MRSSYVYRRDLPHIQKELRAVFATFNTCHRKPLPKSTRSIILDCCKFVHSRTAFVHIAVVMPEHVHMVLTPLAVNGRTCPLWEIFQSIKSVSARRINRMLHRTGSVWQEETFDHVLRSEESLERKIEYVRQNPVRRGLCQRPEDYPWLWLNPEPFHL